MSKIENLISFNSKHRKHLVEAIEGLVTTPCRFNVLSKDSKQASEWLNIRSGLLADVGFPDTMKVCHYSFGNQLSRLLRSPSVYARINLWVQAKISGKHAHALYEFYKDALGAKRSVVEIRCDAQDLRCILALEDAYPEWREFNRAVIQKAHKEINKSTDLVVDEVSKIKSGRQVTGLVIRVAKRPGEEGDELQAQAFEEQMPDDTDAIFKWLREIFGPGASSHKMISEYGEDRVLANLVYAKNMQSKGKVKSLAAYARAAIENDYAGNADVESVRKTRPQAASGIAAGRQSISADKPTSNVKAMLESLTQAQRAELEEEFEKSEDFLRLRAMASKGLSAGNPIYVGGLINFLQAKI